MPRLTERLEIQYPEEFDEPYFDTFVSTMNSIDLSAFAAILNTNTIVTGGGAFEWDLNNEELSWNEVIKIRSIHFGFYTEVEIDTVSLDGNWIVYTEIARLNKETVNVQAGVANQLSPQKENYPEILVLAIREGDNIIFRNGRVIEPGGSKNIFSNPIQTSTSDGTSGLYWSRRL